MKASFTKRFVAYILDFLFISAILMIISYFIPKNTNINYLNADINNISEQLLNNKITFQNYFKEYADYISDIDRFNVIYNVISIIVLLIYYVIIPVIFKTTLGKHIMHLKIKRKDDKKLNIFNTFIRSIIIDGILYTIITVFLVQILSNAAYLISLIIFGIIQLILVFISAFMILYRKDKQGLQDILSKSNVIINEVR